MEYYLDKELLKQGKICVRHKFDTDSINLLDPNLIKYIGDDIPSYIVYDEETNKIKESSFLEYIKLGFRKLEEGQVIVNEKIELYNPKFQYIKDNKIENKTREMLIIEGIEKPFDNEYLKEGVLKSIPPIPQEYIHGIFNIETESWRENATLEEQENYYRNKIIILNRKIIDIESTKIFSANNEKIELEKLKLKHQEVSHLLGLEIDKTIG